VKVEELRLTRISVPLLGKFVVLRTVIVLDGATVYGAVSATLPGYWRGILSPGPPGMTTWLGLPTVPATAALRIVFWIASKFSQPDLVVAVGAMNTALPAGTANVPSSRRNFVPSGVPEPSSATGTLPPTRSAFKLRSTIVGASATIVSVAESTRDDDAPRSTVKNWAPYSVADEPTVNDPSLTDAETGASSR
jgi:hypothetical protein